MNLLAQLISPELTRLIALTLLRLPLLLTASASIHGVSPEFIEQLQALGYKHPINVGDAHSRRHAGVHPQPENSWHE